MSYDEHADCDKKIKDLKAKNDRLQSIASENQKISDGWRESYLKAINKLEAEEAKTKELHKARQLMQKCLDRYGVLDLHELRDVKVWLGDKE